jgi:hypothetical protein
MWARLPWTQHYFYRRRSNDKRFQDFDYSRGRFYSYYKHAISCDDDLAIENGSIIITSAVKDGIHVNNTITVNGGTIKITATSDCQCVAVLSGVSANQAVTIKKADGTQVLEFTPTKTGATLVFSSPSLTANTSYTLYVNGTQSRTFTTSSIVTVSGGSIFGAGGGGGMQGGGMQGGW